LPTRACSRRILAAAGNRLEPIIDSYPAISPNFIHHTQVVRGGQFEYALKQGLVQMLVTARAETGEAACGEGEGSRHAQQRDHPDGLSRQGLLAPGAQQARRNHDYLKIQVDNIPSRQAESCR
jgi:hypothetical protein